MHGHFNASLFCWALFMLHITHTHTHATHVELELNVCATGGSRRWKRCSMLCCSLHTQALALYFRGARFSAGARGKSLSVACILAESTASARNIYLQFFVRSSGVRIRHQNAMPRASIMPYFIRMRRCARCWRVKSTYISLCSPLARREHRAHTIRLHVSAPRTQSGFWCKRVMLYIML